MAAVTSFSTSRLLNALQRIKQVNQDYTNLDDMLNDTLGEFLNIFNCDRAWLLYPCDIDSLDYQVKIERHRPQWPGALHSNTTLPMNDFARHVMLRSLSAHEAITFDVYTDPVFSAASEVDQFKIKSQITLALRIKTGRPWLLGIHHCAEHPHYDAEDLQIFQELGHRLGEALNNLLALQEMQGNINYLNAMERISRIAVRFQDVNPMLHKMLEECMDIFNSDRTWLLSPCNPDASTSSLPISCWRSEWPGLATGQEVASSEMSRNLFSQALATRGAITITVDDPVFATDNFVKQFKIKSLMCCAIYPKVGDPWLLGLHHCEQTHHFQYQEIQLFEEIGLRIADSLSTLISLRDLQISEARFRTLVEHVPEAIIVFNQDTLKLVELNSNALNLFGYSRDQLLDNTLATLSAPLQAHNKSSQELIDTCLAQPLSGESLLVEWLFVTSQQETIHCEIRLLRLPGSQPTLIRGSISDISERKVAEAQMRKLSQALQHTADAIMITDEHGIIEYTNNAYEQMTGFSYQESAGQTPEQLHAGDGDEAIYQELWQTVRAGHIYSGEFAKHRKDGNPYYEEVTITPLLNSEGCVTHFIFTGRDITDRMATQQQLQHLAHHDVLTNLPNRSLLMDRTDQAISQASRNNGQVAVLFLDLDHFKRINDSLGHEAGDKALQHVAQVLRQLLRTSDTVARIGGDEFVVVLHNVEHMAEVHQVTHKILTALAKPIEVSSQELFISTSIGIALFPDDARDSRNLIKHADIAMYRAKQQGRNTHEFYSSDMSTKATARMALETQLRQAIKQQEFRLHYQPQVDVQSGEIIGAEALIRWQPEQGITIFPHRFIPILEETGLITEVGAWVLQESCQQLSRWHKIKPKLRMSINLSSRQFQDSQLENHITHSRVSNKLSPQDIELEITESLLVDYGQQTLSLLEKLNHQGYRLAIDDFGTGYSSLSYLKRFPITALKIDQSFIRDIDTDPDDAAIVRAIIAMAHSLKLDVVAEGIETQSQLAFIKEHQCATAQGFLFDVALSAPEFERILKRATPPRRGT